MNSRHSWRPALPRASPGPLPVRPSQQLRAQQRRLETARAGLRCGQWRLGALPAALLLAFWACFHRDHGVARWARPQAPRFGSAVQEVLQ